MEDNSEKQMFKTLVTIWHFLWTPSRFFLSLLLIDPNVSTTKVLQTSSSYSVCGHNYMIKTKVAFLEGWLFSSQPEQFYPANQNNLKSFQKVLIGLKKAGPPKKPLLCWSCKLAKYNLPHLFLDCVASELLRRPIFDHSLFQR